MKMRAIVAATLWLTATAIAAEAPPVDAARVLQRAFDARHACALASVIEIETRKGGAQAQRRRLEVATKAIEGRLHTYAVFREPPHVRGLAFLSIEATTLGRSEERFVYLPSLRKIRRVSGSQSDDAFLGTDLSHHDFERQREGSYESAVGGRVRVGDEDAWLIVAKPRSAEAYERVEHTIAARDHAILFTRYFKRGSPTAYKQLAMDRARIVESGACRVPARIHVDDFQRGTSTVLELESLQLDADLPDDLFSIVSLETKRAVPIAR